MRTKLIAVLAGLLVVATGVAHAKVRVRQSLTAAAAGSSARGVARLALKTGSEGEFKLQVRHLDRHATYAVLVGGMRVADVTTNGGGSGGVRFRTRPHSPHDLPL